MPSEHYSENQPSSTTQSEYASPRQLNGQNGATPHSNGKVTSTDLESPELLRWRADMLLDEMLLGGADIGTTFRGLNGSSSNGVHSHSTNGHNDGMGEQSSTNGFGHDATHAPILSASMYPTQVTPQNQYEAAPVTNATENNSTNSEPAQPLLVSAEQRYARINQPPTPSRPTNNPAPNVITEIEQPVIEPTSAVGLGPVRRVSVNGTLSNGASAPGTMSVASRGSKYSTLLPRESNVDPEVLQREITSLSQQLAAETPPGHESRERAQKLLDKANTILQSDPLRSAEVDYYLQQVRAMIERLRQSVDYSALYQRRLQTYLLAWFTLALVVIVGCFLYGQQLAQGIAVLANWGERSVGAQHLSALILTLFAGGLGGTLCALWSIYKQTHRESGFLDRKFSLRSLILPLTGFVAGLVIYLVLGLAYWFFGADPSRNLWIALVPMLFTFILALGQDMLFGVRS